jgi:hypothetical protein
MVIAPIAAAAAPAVVQSATDNDGLINKLFKIGMLIGVLALAAISIVILSFVINIADVIGATFSLFGTVLDVISIAAPFPFNLLGVAATGLLSAFGFGGRR